MGSRVGSGVGVGVAVGVAMGAGMGVDVGVATIVGVGVASTSIHDPQPPVLKAASEGYISTTDLLLARMLLAIMSSGSPLNPFSLIQ